MDWSPEEQGTIEYFKGLDKVSHSIAAYMLNDKLPLQTISKLLPLAELACRNKDPAGALVFSGIETPFPCVKYYANAGSLIVALLRHRSNHYVLPLGPVFEIAMHRSSASTQ